MCVFQFFIDPAKLLPLARFLPRPPGQKPTGPRGGRGGGRGELFLTVLNYLHSNLCCHIIVTTVTF